MSKRLAGGLLSVSVIAILAVGLLYFGKSERYSKEDKLRVQMRVIAQSLQDYAARKGAFPPEREGLGVLVAEKEFNAEGLKDPWGQEISYKCLKPGCESIRLASRGPTEGDSRPSADIFSLEVTRTHPVK